MAFPHSNSIVLTTPLSSLAACRRLLLLLPMVALATGCATITADKSQPLTVQTTCNGKVVNGATCEMVNSKGVFVVQTPGSTSVRKSFGAMTINCRLEEARGSLSIDSSSNVNTWGNLIAGGVVGAVVDAGTGAGYEYTPSVVVAMQGQCPDGG